MAHFLGIVPMHDNCIGLTFPLQFEAQHDDAQRILAVLAAQPRTEPSVQGASSRVAGVRALLRVGPAGMLGHSAMSL